MTKLSEQFFLLLTISYIINQFNVQGQSTMGITSNQQISNLTLSSLFMSSQSNSTNSMMTTLIMTTILPSHTTGSFMTPFSTSRTNRTRPVRPIATNVSRPSSILPPIIMINTTRRTSVRSTTTTHGQQYSSTLSNSGRKYELSITFFISAHFLLFIFPID